MRRLILGCGYLGRRVANRWLDAGDDVWAVTRSAERAESLRQAGMRPVVWDVTNESVEELPHADTVLFAVGYDRSANHPIHSVYVDGLARTLDRLPANTGRLIYISSTGVYSQNDGQWVDEDSPAEPNRDGGRACLAAEQLLTGHPLGQRAIILRLAGIYGPDRIPRRADLLAGKPIAATPDSYLNLIQVEDAADIVVTVAAADLSLPKLYTVSDGNPALRADYYAELSRLLDAPPPTFQFADAVPAASAPETKSPNSRRSTGDKRISNQRLTQELPIRFHYPTYRHGLADAVERLGGET
ncbi:MAG: NAD-dependent epimerase/dehydratase family protein [Pirellulaceae bacterium]